MEQKNYFKGRALAHTDVLVTETSRCNNDILFFLQPVHGVLVVCVKLLVSQSLQPSVGQAIFPHLLFPLDQFGR